MAKTIRAIVIDPFLQEVREIQMGTGIKDLYEAIGCSCVQTVAIAGSRNVAWVDEEGLLKPDLAHGWYPKGWGQQPLMGLAVITECDKNGDIASTQATVEQVRRIIGGWHQGSGPEPVIKLWSAGDKCQMCDQRVLTDEDIRKAFSTGRALCSRCRREP
jgi:hypothetical protein